MTEAQVRNALAELARVAGVVADEAPQVVALAQRYQATLEAGGTLFFAGNGGSAADAQHLATEYVVRFRRTRDGLPAVALTTDTSLLTAVGNDLGFDEIFARQVATLCRPADLLVLHSTSGSSANLVRAAEAAAQRGTPVVAFLGKGGGALARLADESLVVASEETSHIQEIHLAVEHIIAGLVEDALAES